MKTLKNYKVLYRFGDNDFGATFRRVFELLREKFEYEGSDQFLDKEYVCWFINTLAFPMYKAMQDHEPERLDERRFSSMDEQDAYYRNYLKATPDRIYIGSEVDEVLVKDWGCVNSSWYVYDSSIHDPKMRVYVV